MKLFSKEKSPLNAFENCPNNVFQKNGGVLEVVCPQYPFGSRDVANEYASSIGEKDSRTAIAQKLGCATCRYGSELFERVDVQRIALDGSMEVEVRFIPATNTNTASPA